MNWTAEQCRSRILDEMARTNSDTAALTEWWLRITQWFSDRIDDPGVVPAWQRLVGEWDKLHPNGEKYYAEKSFSSSASRHARAS
jgi:hypothetical protein